MAMKITEIVASRSVKLNNGNFESTDLFLSVKAEDPEGIAPGERLKLETSVESAMLATLVRVYKQKGMASSPHKIAKHHSLSLAAGRDDVKIFKKD
jgi:hypothetical protein